jgi:hypothetical protein
VVVLARVQQREFSFDFAHNQVAMPALPLSLLRVQEQNVAPAALAVADPDLLP